MRFPPFFASKEEADRTYIACGRAALNWGPIELFLEWMLLELRRLQRDQFREAVPNSFSMKWREIKDRLRKKPDLEDAFRPLLTEAKRVHGLRSTIVHSLCQGTNVDGELIFGHSAPKHGIAYTDLRMLIPAVEQLAEDMRELRGNLADPAREFDRH